MDLKSDIEENLRRKIKSYFAESYFYSHTIAAVFYMKELIKKEGGNERILLPAIYLHDIGYPEVLAGKKNDYSNHHSAKILHMQVGANISKNILNELNFNANEIKEIAHLISVHDNKIINTNNEQMVFEADSLSMIDRKMVNPDFSKKDYEKFLISFEKSRMPLFKTKYGKESLMKLFPLAKSYFCE
jgi:HD superfamily phosphodiesterase